MKDAYQKLSRALEQVLLDSYPEIEIELPLWQVPDRSGFGDLSAMAALRIAPRIKDNPYTLALGIKDKLEPLVRDIGELSVLKPGFINIFFSRGLLTASLKKLLSDREKYFSADKKRKVLIEFVSANPTGPLSVAHGRQAVVGDVIANTLEFLGNEVVREYYLNDEGKQIELLIDSVKERMKEIRGEEFSIPEGGYLGEYIKDIARGVLSGNPGGNIRETVLEAVISRIKKDLNSLGVEFNSWRSQKRLIDDNKVDESIAFLREKGFVYEDQGAVWFSSSKFGDDKDRVLIKNNGEGTYFASDIAYHRDKINRKFDLLINLWGPDHHGYIPRVKSAITALGLSADALKISIIQLVIIKTRQRMSRRAGTAILLSDLIEEVGKSAARFYYIMRKNSSPLEFDLDKAKEVSFDNPLYYVQYAHARICSIFEKTGGEDIPSDYIKYLDDEQEFVLLRKIFQLEYCLNQVYNTYEPVYLIEYLKDLANSFHKFYENKRVLGDKQEISYARLNLLLAVRTVISCGLKILGIEPLVHM